VAWRAALQLGCEAARGRAAPVGYGLPRARTRGCTVAATAESRDARGMLTPKVTELSRAGHPRVTTPLPPARPLSLPR